MYHVKGSDFKVGETLAYFSLETLDLYDISQVNLKEHRNYRKIIQMFNVKIKRVTTGIVLKIVPDSVSMK